MVMKVVLLSTSDIGHGAGVAAYRLYRSLVNAGVDSKMLVCEKKSDDDSVIEIISEPNNKLLKILKKIVHKFENFVNYFGPQCVFSLLSIFLLFHPLVKSADIIHFHNIHWTRKNLSLLLLFLKKPVIWTLHDMWPATGHCIYSYDCENWKSGCGKCPDLNIYLPLSYDSTAFQWKLKKYIYNKSRPVIVSPSRWLEQITNDSPLFDNCLKYRVPYGVDHAEFLPMNKREARQKLRLKEDCKYLLWAASDVNDERKGFKYFERAMESFASLASTDNIEILIVGRSYSRSSTIENHFEVKNIGHLENFEELSHIISAANIFITTSIQDNLPNIILESLSCGTPVVGFGIGGIPDMVTNGENGLLIFDNNHEHLASAISEIIFDDTCLREMEISARKKILEEFTFEKQAAGYELIYKYALEI